MRISTQLRLGLGLILVLVLALGALAWLQASRLWEQTQGLHEHPLAVRRALGRLEADTERLARLVRDLHLTGNDRQTIAVLQGMELANTDAEQQFAILSERYLGPRDDVANLHNEFTKWGTLRTETVRLFRAGETAVAEARLHPGGIEEEQAVAFSDSLKRVDDYSRNRSEQFYLAATAQRDAITRNLAVIIGAILVLSLGVAWLLLEGLRRPLAELTAVTEQFREGRMDVRIRTVATNEFGALAASFNAMAEAIQTQAQIDRNVAQLADVMLREEDVHAFCRELLKALLTHTGSQIGAVYFLNEAKTAFEHFDSIGLGPGARAPFSATELEGELGAVLATRQIQRITGIPADTRFAFAAVSGEFKPREILTIPVLTEQEVTAVVSLASVRTYDAVVIRAISDVWSVLTARVNGVLAFRKIRDFAARLEQQNRELEEQKRELAAQTAELTEMNAELEMQKRQLDEANRLKSAFLSNMSHELRTPLNSVIALSGVLNRRLAGKIASEEYGYLDVIERNGKNLLTLINDILDLSRIEAGREEVSIAQFPMRAVVGELVAMLEPQAQEKGIKLASLVGDDLPQIASDPHLCRHILQNLIGNAVKFTDAGGVEIAARQQGDELYVSVRDTGIGIAADQLPHIFDEFWQADGTSSRKYGGTGLGLAIARKYAGLLHGRITAESTLGKGSTFTFALPLRLSLLGAETAPPPAALLPAAPLGVGRAQPGGAPAGQGQCILLVEDNEPAVIQMADILTSQGYRVQVARDGNEALAAVGQALPDAMILDLMMPQVDGFQVLKAIREREATAHLPVLILTAKHVTREELSFLKGNHIQQLIQKGDVSRAELLAAVARMVAPAPSAKPELPPRARVRRQRSGKPVVLVVEDNPDNLRTMRALLQDTYTVLEATDGRAGVEQARAHRPDLILTDIAMPVMDGLDALRLIRADEALRSTPVLAVTASAMKGDQETILAHGFDGYLSKPVDAALLRKTLRELLD
jgi:signal transduction histidine kinase/DNA-binding response OmpR family regulator